MGEDLSLMPGDEAPGGWVMYFDGAIVHQAAVAGVVVISLT